MNSDLQTKMSVTNKGRKSSAEMEEVIRQRAHQLYEERQRGDGHDLEDWLDAEAELMDKDKTRIRAA